MRYRPPATALTLALLLAFAGAALRLLEDPIGDGEVRVEGCVLEPSKVGGNSVGGTIMYWSFAAASCCLADKNGRDVDDEGGVGGCNDCCGGCHDCREGIASTDVSTAFAPIVVSTADEALLPIGTDGASVGVEYEGPVLETTGSEDGVSSGESSS